MSVAPVKTAGDLCQLETFFLTLVLSRNAFDWGLQKSEYEAISVSEEAKTRSDAALLLVQPDPGSPLKNKPSGLLLDSLYFGRKLGPQKINL